MAPEIQTVVRTTQAWLQSSWHVQVPFAWLEACVEWLREEAGGTGRLSQQQINQQVLDQWLLTDLRDLDYPVLPEGLVAAQRTELNGTFCVQVDSLLDISQPAYSQLQTWKGTDCANDEVSAVTQTTQRPWEAKPTRMLLLQVTDGVQSLEAMEYQPIPALSTELRPGVKLQLQGKIICRLGMLLLGPSNVKVLGGEVEDLVERNNKGRVLCRTLGLPEEQQQQQQQPPQQPQQEEEEAPLLQQQRNQEMEDLEVDDVELLASVEAQGEVERPPVGLWSVPESGYGTLSETYSQSSRTSSVRSHVSAAPSRIPQSLSMTEEDFPDEDFDDLPLDELDSVIFQEATNIAAQSDSSHRGTPPYSGITGNPNNLDRDTNPVTQERDNQGHTKGARGQLATPTSTSFSSPTALEASHEVAINESDFMDEDMDCFFEEVEPYGVQPERSGGANQLPVQQGLSRDRESAASTSENPGCSYSLSSKSLKSATERSHSTPQGQTDSVRLSSKKDPQSDSTVPALTLASLPFTYLCLLEDLMSKPQTHTIEICVKAFIVTLSGKLTSKKGVWSICAAISDGTGYLDVELSDEVLTSLLGFSVAEKEALKRDPARRGELDTGMKRCQEELVDMCCIMTILVEPQGRKAVVTKADQVSEKVLQELEQRVRARKR